MLVTSIIDSVQCFMNFDPRVGVYAPPIDGCREAPLGVYGWRGAPWECNYIPKLITRGYMSVI